MFRTSARPGPATVLLVALALGLAGCSLFAPEGGEPPGTVTGGYKERTTCPNVINNLTLSYQKMESDKYIELLADDFTFWPNPEDVNDPNNNIPEYWGRTDEAEIAHNMLDEGLTNVNSIQLTLTHIGDAVEIPGPNPDDPVMWEYTYSVDLYVNLPNELTYWANAPSKFTFAEDPNETGPNGETLWEIYKWEDIDARSRPIEPGDFQRVSLTDLKTMFR